MEYKQKLQCITYDYDWKITTPLETEKFLLLFEPIVKNIFSTDEYRQMIWNYSI